VSYTIALWGEIDHAQRRELRRLAVDFHRSQDADAVLDLSNVSFFDSTGLSLVVTLARVAKARGGRLTVIGASAEVRPVLETTHMDWICDLAG
jgi:anti-sigma B factor antagonist